MLAIYNLIISTLMLTSTLNPVSDSDSHVIDKFHVIGISVRTTNAAQSTTQAIEKLWGRWWNEEIQKQIPNSISSDIYALYTDYESDFNGAYTLIIGVPVSSLETIPEGFVGITVEKDQYKKYTSKGKMPEAVLNTWMEIWQSPDLNREYRVDFTVHGKKYFDGDQAEVETYISVK